MEKKHLKNLDVDARIILNIITEKHGTGDDSASNRNEHQE
jgi:hypothetical protein